MAHSEAQTLQVFLQLGKFTKDSSILDAGCGPGLVSLFLARHVKHVRGVDLTGAMIARAKEDAARAGLKNVTFELGDMSRLPYADNTFDGSITRYTFHHLERPGDALKEMLRVVKPGGRVVVCDSAPASAKQDSFNKFERLRDPSHTTALTQEQLIALGTGLSEAELEADLTQRLVLPLDAEQLIAKAFPEKLSREDLLDLLRKDEAQNQLDFNVGRDGDGKLTMTFPLCVMVWRKKG